MAVILLTEDYFKQNLPVTLNVDFQSILSGIIIAQDRYVLDTLGTNLYTTVINNVTANTLSGSYAKLATDYIQPVVLWGGLYEAFPWLQFKITNQGVVTRVSENGVAATDDQFKFLRENIRNNMEQYQQRLVKYLIASPSLFPEYNTGNSTIDTIKPRRRHIYNNGIYLGNGGIDNCTWGMDFPEDQHPIR